MRGGGGALLGNLFKGEGCPARKRERKVGGEEGQAILQPLVTH